MLEARGEGAELLPRLPLAGDEALGGDRSAAGPSPSPPRSRPCPRGEATAAPALLLGEQGEQIVLRVGAAPRHAGFEPAGELDQPSNLHRGRAIVHAGQKAVEQPEFVVGELRRAGLDLLSARGWRGGGGGGERSPSAGPLCWPTAHTARD